MSKLEIEPPLEGLHRIHIAFEDNGMPERREAFVKLIQGISGMKGVSIVSVSPEDHPIHGMILKDETSVNVRND